MGDSQEFRRSRIGDLSEEKESSGLEQRRRKSSALKKRLKDAWAVRKSKSRESGGSTHSTPLHIAATHNRLAACQFLLARKADVDAQNKYGDTASQHAAALGHLEVLRFLIQQGADIDHKGTHRGVSRKSVREYADESMEVREAMERGLEEHKFLSEEGSSSESAALTTENLKTWMKQQQDKGIIDASSSLSGSPAHSRRSPHAQERRESFSKTSQSRSEKSMTMSISDFSEFSSRDIMDYDEIKLEEGMTLSDYYDEMQLPEAHETVSVTSAGSYQSSVASHASQSSQTDAYIPEIIIQNVVEPNSLLDLNVFFTYVKHHLRHRSIIVQTNIPHFREWLDGSTMNMKSRSRTTRVLDKEIENYNTAVRLQTSILHDVRLICPDRGSVNQGTVEFSFPNFDRQLFFVSKFAVVEAWNFFIGSSVRCWSDECWDNALQSECIGKEFMQVNTDISLWFTANDPETRSKTKKIANDDQAAMLHNLSLAAYISSRKRDDPLADGERIFFSSILDTLPKNKNKKVLELVETSYVYNPTQLQLAELLKTDASRWRILAKPVDWLICFRSLMLERYGRLCSLIEAIRKWQGLKKQKSAKSRKKRSNRRWAVELLEKATREELDELSELLSVIPEIHVLQATLGHEITTPRNPSRSSSRTLSRNGSRMGPITSQTLSVSTREQLLELHQTLTTTSPTATSGDGSKSSTPTCSKCGTGRQIDGSTGVAGQFCIKCGQEYPPEPANHTPQTTWVRIVELVNDAADQGLFGEQAGSNLVQLITNQDGGLFNMAEPLITANMDPKTLTKAFAQRAIKLLNRENEAE